jgi:hypothetical protein
MVALRGEVVLSPTWPLAFALKFQTDPFFLTARL